MYFSQKKGFKIRFGLGALRFGLGTLRFGLG
jgi:hypothetical protein